MSRRVGPTALAASGNSVSSLHSLPAQDAHVRQLVHARAAHGASGTNTELRALLRKEREMEKRIVTATKESEPSSRKVQSNASTGMTTSLSDKKLTQNGSNGSLASSGAGVDDNDGPRRAPSRQACGPPTGNALLTAAAIANKKAPAPHAHLLDRDDNSSSASGGHKLSPPPDAFDHSFGIDALQAAFSAKYYELANKCKNWEKYAAKLRAQNEALEVENRVLREQNVELEAEVIDLKDQRHRREQERYRVEIESRLSTLEDRLSHRSHSGGDLGDQYQSGETLIELDRISAPSAPSSAEKSVAGRAIGQIGYCSSNLQVEDRPELRPPTPVSAISLPALLPSVPMHDPYTQFSSTGRRSLNHPRDATHEWPAQNARRESASLAEIINQDAAHRESGALYGEGRSSRLGSRTVDTDGYAAAPRSGTLPTSATFPPGPNSHPHDSSALTSQALAAMNRQHASMMQRPQRVSVSPGRQGRISQQGHHPDARLAPTQSKRRSTISGDRTLDLGLHPASLAENNAATAMLIPSNGIEPRSRGPSALSDAPTVTGDYLQEYVEQRRQLRRTSFTAQQQQMALAAGSAPGSRPVSRMSNASAGGDRTRRARSRAGSVHDAIPVAKDDVFCEGSATLHPSKSASPLGENKRIMNSADLANVGRDSPSPQSKERRAMMEARRARPTQASDASLSSSSLYSGIADYSSSSNEQRNEDEDQRRTHRKLYASLRNELDYDDLVKFEKYVHRYDGLEIPLDGPKGLINRVKKLLLLTDPALKSKPEKLRIRKDLARQFEKVVRSSVPP